ncbi:hypothetical protein AcV5_001215 [Taiwanofungus camphoratus]|nr:hypothetical protein AcV5_001215 [Antrodia cinnamomea]
MIQLKHPPLTSVAGSLLHTRVSLRLLRYAFANRPAQSLPAVPRTFLPFSPSRHQSPCALPSQPCSRPRTHLPPAPASYRRELIGFPRASLGGHPGARRISGTHSRSIASGLSHPDLTSTHMLHAGQRRDRHGRGFSESKVSQRKTLHAEPAPPPPGTASHSRPVPVSAPSFVSFALLAVGPVCLSWTGGARGQVPAPVPVAGIRAVRRYAPPCLYCPSSSATCAL